MHAVQLFGLRLHLLQGDLQGLQTGISGLVTKSP